MDEERYAWEKKYYNVPADPKKHVNYRLMKENEIPSWFIETVVYKLFSPKIRRGTKNTVEVIE